MADLTPPPHTHTHTHTHKYTPLGFVILVVQPLLLVCTIHGTLGINSFFMLLWLKKQQHCACMGLYAYVYVCVCVYVRMGYT